MAKAVPGGLRRPVPYWSALVPFLLFMVVMPQLYIFNRGKAASS